LEQAPKGAPGPSGPVKSRSSCGQNSGRSRVQWPGATTSFRSASTLPIIPSTDFLVTGQLLHQILKGTLFRACCEHNPFQGSQLRIGLGGETLELRTKLVEAGLEKSKSLLGSRVLGRGACTGGGAAAVSTRAAPFGRDPFAAAKDLQLLLSLMVGPGLGV
jgi:hypothetical protein